MQQNFGVSVLLSVFFGVASGVFAQTAVPKTSIVPGDVVSVSEAKIVLKAQSGPVDVLLGAATEFKKVPADNPTLKAAVPAALSDIVIGDKLMVTGIPAADGKSIPAKAVYLMSKSDIAQKNAKETAEWRTRGIYGKVISANAATNQLTVEVRGMMGAATNVVLTPKSDATFKRYAPDSIKFSEALNSSMAEIRAGDMLRALGDRSTDGTSFSAEEVITGAFQTIAGTVKSIDPEKNEVVISEMQTKKDVTVALGPTSTMKRFPAEIAERMAGMQMAGAGGARPVGQPGGQPPAAGGQPGQGTPQGQGRPGMGGRGGIDDMMDRFPDIKVADLKAGDMIALSSTKNGTMERVKAIKLVAGVEPFLRAAQAAGAGRGQGQQIQFNIPGLDGIGTP